MRPAVSPRCEQALLAPVARLTGFTQNGIALSQPHHHHDGMVGGPDLHHLAGVSIGVIQRQEACALLNRLSKIPHEQQRRGHIAVGDQPIRFAASLGQCADLERQRVTRRQIPGYAEHYHLERQSRDEA